MCNVGIRVLLVLLICAGLASYSRGGKKYFLKTEKKNQRIILEIKKKKRKKKKKKNKPGKKNDLSKGLFYPSINCSLDSSAIVKIEVKLTECSSF